MTELLSNLSDAWHGIAPPKGDRLSVRQAKATYASFRSEYGFVERYSALLTHPSDSVKLSKGDEATYGLSLAPANLTVLVNVCPWSTKGCRDLCLNTSGKGTLDSVQLGRKVKTLFMAQYPTTFLTILDHELTLATKRAHRKGQIMAMRMNVLSDIPWEQAIPEFFAKHGTVQFYDYTKNFWRSDLPSNYTLTLSASERYGDAKLIDLVESGQNVTIIADTLANGEVPTTWHGLPVHNGDLSDFRPGDPTGVVVWLKPKGKARKAERGGFVRTIDGFA